MTQDPLNDGSPPFFGLLNPNSCPIFVRKMTMFVDEFLLCWLHPQFCVSTWSKTDGTDIGEWSTMTEYHGICTIFSNCWFPVISGSQLPPCSSSHLHVRLIPVSGSAGMLLGRLVSWKQRSWRCFQRSPWKVFPLYPPIQSISILFKVIQMCFFRFDSLTQFCVLFWLSQGRTARTLDLPMKIIGFWAQTQQQREHWSSKARGNELKMCMWSGNGWGCKQWISVM